MKDEMAKNGRHGWITRNDICQVSRLLIPVSPLVYALNLNGLLAILGVSINLT